MGLAITIIVNLVGATSINAVNTALLTITVVSAINSKFLVNDIVRAVMNRTEPSSLYLEITIIVSPNLSNPFTLTSFAYLETHFLNYVFNLT